MEYIKSNGAEYACKSVTTGINSISFTMEGRDIETIYTVFKNITDISVCGEDKVTYGIYGNLVFESTAVDKDGNITVKYRIKDDTETRIDELEQKCAKLEEENAEMKQIQTEQDSILAELIYGSEKEVVEETTEETQAEMTEAASEEPAVKSDEEKEELSNE